METSLPGIKPYITTRNGTVVEFLNPKPEQIKIDDIAWHLARTCRFNGHTNLWYSNAEHSILCARRTTATKLGRYCLIHDAAEYVFGDISSPVGALCPEYKKLIRDFQKYLYIHYIGSYEEEFDNQVKEIDHRMCATEMKYLRRQPDHALWTTPYDDAYFYCWEWKEAYTRYLTAFYLMFPEHKK